MFSLTPSSSGRAYSAGMARRKRSLDSCSWGTSAKYPVLTYSHYTKPKLTTERSLKVDALEAKVTLDAKGPERGCILLEKGIEKLLGAADVHAGSNETVKML